MHSEPHAVFISYSWDDDDHIRNVLSLAQWLRSDGVDAWLDKFDSPAEPWPLWCYRQVEGAEAVLVVCTETYRRRVMREQSDGTGRGATWEGAVISNEVYSSVSGQGKFIPVVFSPADIQYVPFFLEGYSVYDLSDQDGRTDLYARLTGQRRVIPEVLGPRHPIARQALETALPIGEDIRNGGAGAQMTTSAQRLATRPQTTKSLGQLIEGEWIIDVLNPMIGNTTIRLRITKSALGKRRFEGSAVAGGIPGWSSSGQWEVIAPGNRVAFRGTQMLGPYQAAPLEEVFTFGAMSHSELAGVNAAGMQVSWHRQ